MDKATADVISRRRAELGLSQAELAQRVGVDPRQMRRYESGESQPSLGVARNIAAALDITIDELAGSTPTYAGRWYTCWEDTGGGEPLSGWVDVTHRGHTVEVSPARAGEDLSDHGKDSFAWRGGLRADDEDLLGWYSIDSPPHRSRGTLMLKRHGETINGTWISVSLKAGFGTGSLGMGRTEAEARQALTVKLSEANK